MEQTRPIATMLANTLASTTPVDDSPPAVDTAGIMRLLADLLAARVRAVARGEGAVHLYGGLTPDLRDRLARYADEIDRLVAWVRWTAPDRPRITPATQPMARMQAAGVRLTALPDGTVSVSPRPTTDALAALTPRGRAEVWFRLAAGLPHPDAEAELARAHPGIAAGLHAYCLRRAIRAAAARHDAKARRWAAFAAAVASLREGRGVVSPLLADLAAHCRRQEGQLARRDQRGAAAKWAEWAQALGA